MTLVGTVQNGVVVLPPDSALPDGTEVRIETLPPIDSRAAGLAECYAVLSRRFSSGERDVAARHNEHQP